MIVSYADKRTERFGEGLREKAFDGIRKIGRVKLDRLKSAQSLEDVASFPGNRLERLQGDRAGQFSIRVNDQWRICFEWDASTQAFAKVELVDYH